MIELRVEVFVKDNGVLLDLLEQIKAMKGVRDVVWTELIEPIVRVSSLAHFSKELEIEPNPFNLVKNVLKMQEKPAFSPLPAIPVLSPVEVPLDLPERSPEELRILERITVNGQ